MDFSTPSTTTTPEYQHIQTLNLRTIQIESRTGSIQKLFGTPVS